MDIQLEAQESVVRDRIHWKPSKEAAFFQLQTQSIDRVASAIREDRAPPESLRERYQQPAKPGAAKSAQVWLMASRVARVGRAYKIVVFYFGPEREIIDSEFSVDQLIHDGTVDLQTYTTRWQGKALVVEPVAVAAADVCARAHIFFICGHGGSGKSAFFLSYGNQDNGFSERIKAAPARLFGSRALFDDTIFNSESAGLCVVSKHWPFQRTVRSTSTREFVVAPMCSADW